jgi:hypothetical protein
MFAALFRIEAAARLDKAKSIDVSYERSCSLFARAYFEMCNRMADSVSNHSWTLDFPLRNPYGFPTNFAADCTL